MRFRLPTLSLAVLAWLGLAAGLGAQESSANIHGQVVDEKNNPVGGATLVLTGVSAPSTTASD